MNVGRLRDQITLASQTVQRLQTLQEATQLKYEKLVDKSNAREKWEEENPLP